MKPRPRVAVIGAGPTGLTNACLLAEAGFDVTVFEAAPRVGGKIRTYQGFRRNGRGPRMEKGPEFIDEQHGAVRTWLDELGVKLQDIRLPERGTLYEDITGTPARRFRHEEEIGLALRELWEQSMRDCELSLSDWPQWNAHAQALDRMSMREYVDAYTSHLTDKDHWGKEALYRALTPDYGLGPDDVSALNFVCTFGSNRGRNFSIRGVSDEGFKVIGGMQTMIERMQERFNSVEGHREIRTACPVTALRGGAEGIQLTFLSANGAHARTRRFDAVVSAVEPEALRHIEGLQELLTNAQFDALAHATPAQVNKIAIPVRGTPHLRSPYRSVRESNGSLVCAHDEEVQYVWLARPEMASAREDNLLIFFLGGDKARELVTAERVERLKRRYAEKVGMAVQDIFIGSRFEATHMGGVDAPSCYTCPTVGRLCELSSFHPEYQALHSKGLYVTGQFIPTLSNDGRGMHIGYIENGVQSAREIVSLLQERFEARLREAARKEKRQACRG
jgi:protoporphyrinogen oxidase